MQKVPPTLSGTMSTLKDFSRCKVCEALKKIMFVYYLGAHLLTNEIGLEVSVGSLGLQFCFTCRDALRSTE